MAGVAVAKLAAGALKSIDAAPFAFATLFLAAEYGPMQSLVVDEEAVPFLSS